jgi:hypothetical protein
MTEYQGPFWSFFKTKICLKVILSGHLVGLVTGVRCKKIIAVPVLAKISSYSTLRI